MNRLLLYSMHLSAQHCQELGRLAGKEKNEILIATIENAADVEPGSESWLGNFTGVLKNEGFRLFSVDLRDYLKDSSGLKAVLEKADIIWVGGGNTWYLRWILKVTGAESIIRKLVAGGKVYAGWSAGALVAGPGLQGLELMEPTQPAPEKILEGMNLLPLVVLPHADHPDFAPLVARTAETLAAAGIRHELLKDDEALLYENNQCRKLVKS